MKIVTIYLADKNIVIIGNHRIHLSSVFQIRKLIKKFNSKKAKVNVVDFYQRIGQLFEHTI